MAASYRMQSVMPVGYSRPSAITNPRTGVQSGWSSFPTRRYPFAARRGALRKAQTGRITVRVRGERDIVASGLDAHMRTRTDAFLGRL